MTEQKDASGVTTLANSYEEAVKQSAARRVTSGDDWPGNPMPDTPRGVPHLNPALNPAPLRADVPERIPVPVVNDPGLVGANPPLHLLNQQVKADLMGEAPDPTMGVTAKSQQDAITKAAEGTQDKVREKIEAAVSQAVSDTQKTAAAEKAAEAKDPAKPAPAPAPSSTPTPDAKK